MTATSSMLMALAIEVVCIVFTVVRGERRD